MEIAFSTNPEASTRRNLYLVSDQQIGIKATPIPEVWNWRKHKQVGNALAFSEFTDRGYLLKAQIPLKSLGIDGFEDDVIYGLEVAIDQGDENGRQEQMRWNSPDAEGFDKNPSMWGEMIFKSTINN